MASPALMAELSCSICLSIYTDPVMLTCGHNFCRVCITKALKSQRVLGLYTCPECKAEFQKQPQLQENMTLRNLIKHFLSTQKEVVFCTYCIHHPVPAVRACVLCEASLCDHHLELHSKSAEHVLLDPNTSFSGRKCSKHKRVLEYYCIQDRACLCLQCIPHRGHLVKPLHEAAAEKKKKLKNILVTLTKNREKVSDEIRQLQTAQSKLARKLCHTDLLLNMVDPLRVLQETESDRDDFCYTEGVFYIMYIKRYRWVILIIFIHIWGIISGVILAKA